MATMKDVAKAANVSLSTVSYVLSGKKQVKDETRRRIMDAIVATGYNLDKKEQSILEGRKGTIGFIIPEMGNSNWSKYFHAAESRLRDLNYDIVCAFGHYNEEREMECLKSMVSNRVDGIIYIGVSSVDAINSIRERIPVVYIDRILSNDYSYVIQDYQQGGYIATEYLLNKGHRNIAFISGPLRFPTYLDNMKGYMDALSNNNIPYNEKIVRESEFTVEAAYETTKKLLESTPTINAIIVASETPCMGAFAALRDMGKRVPEEVALLCQNDGIMTSMMLPKITAMKSPAKEIGKSAADILHEYIENGETKAQQIRLMPMLVERQST